MFWIDNRSTWLSYQKLGRNATALGPCGEGPVDPRNPTDSMNPSNT